ncbi:MAG: DUF1353 domain-containing protein [Methylococcaceae bacterium]
MSASEPHFEPGPHAKLTSTDTEAFRVAEDFVFIDENGKRWEAPAATLTDGASIPQLFLVFTGGQLSKDFRAAAVVHDAYCGVANKGGKSYQIESWRQVHRMFYEACLTCGAPRFKALTMYAAVRLDGPRWEMGNDLSLSKKVPKERLVQEMKRCKTFIEEQSPSIDEVDEWMDAQESKMLESV